MANIQKPTPPDETPAPIVAKPAEKPSENLVILDADKLATTIAAAVAQTMLSMQQQQSSPVPFDMNVLGEVIGAAVAQGIAKNTRRRMTYGEYDKLGPRNSYHPKSKAETPTLKRALWQNETIINPNTLFDREITLANRITHSGRYFDRKVEVIFAEDGENIYIRYNNKTRDQMFELKNHFRSFQELLEHVVKVQEQEDKDVQEREEQLRAERDARIKSKERHFGDNKNYQDAVAAAEAR